MVDADCMNVVNVGTVVLNPNLADGIPAGLTGQPGTSVEDIDPFQRIESAGGFSFSGYWLVYIALFFLH